MYNELLFLLHIVVVSGGVILAIRHSYGATVAVLSLQLIVANLFVTKQIALFGIATTCSEVFVVSGMYGVGLIASYYGPDKAARAVWITFGALLFFVGMTQFHAMYKGINAIESELLALMCASTLRLCAASLCAYLVSERVHLLFLKWLSCTLSLTIRRTLAVVAGQLVDTLVFAGIGLYGMVDHFTSIVCFGIAIKMIVIMVLAPIVAYTHRCVRLVRELDGE